MERVNAKAMINGFEKNGRIIHQAIYLNANGGFPKLITLQKHNYRKFRMSEVGGNLNSDSFSIPYKYVALLKSTYIVKNEMGLWEKICHNGLFDIWKPEAPNKWCNEHSDQTKCKILLIRIWETTEELPEEKIKPTGHCGRWADLTREDCTVTLKKPVIGDEEFLQIKNLLQDTIKDYQISIGS
ncbi:MAG: DUF1802 family protein [Candidatus Omnitrophota bacterium]